MILFRKTSLSKLLSGIQWPKITIMWALLFSILGSFTNLLVPLYTGKFVDKIVSNNFNYYFILLFIAIFLFNTILSGLSVFFLSKMGEKIIYLLREKLWKRIIYLKSDFFDNNETGEIMSRLIEDTNVINNFISLKLPNVLPSLVSVLGSIGILFFLDWKLTLLALVTIPLFFAIVIPLSKIIQNISLKTQQETALFSGLLSRVIHEISLVKISSTEEKEINNAKTNLNSIYHLGIRQARILSIIQPISGTLILITVGLLLGFGGIRVSNGAITSGVLVSMLFYIFQLSTPLISISTLITDYQRAIGASQRIYEMTQNNIESVHFENTALNNDSSLCFQNVNFKYNNELILNDINFTIPPRSTVAFVGPSGAGKSTIFKLITRLYEIEEGNIKYGETPIKKISLKHWRKNIGYVMQHNPMMSGSIKENLLYGNDENQSLDDIIYYSKMANSHEFIKHLHKQYETQIGENGTKLSGGEKQRLDLARNFIKNPKILLLDEATSSLDSDSEQKIQQALRKISQNRTTLIIAHRLSTIKKADYIIFLDKGRITGQGDHEKLLKEHEKYRDFVQNQTL